MPISYKQIFKCFNCGDEIISYSFTDCDSIEDSTCQECNIGVYKWHCSLANSKPATVPLGLDDTKNKLNAVSK